MHLQPPPGTKLAAKRAKGKRPNWLCRRRIRVLQKHRHRRALRARLRKRAL